MTVAARPDAADAARAFVAEHYPWAIAAFLGGSAARGTTTDTSDLDIIVVGAFRAGRLSTSHQGWPVELFVHTPQTLERAFARDVEQREPAMLEIAATGVILRSDGGAAERIAALAAARLHAGPPPLSEAALAQRRFRISDAVDDLRGGLQPAEAVFLAGMLLQECATLELAMAGRWEGHGKQAARHLRALNPERADAAVSAFRALLGGDAQPLIAWAEGSLQLAGGRLWEGYSVDAPQ